MSQFVAVSREHHAAKRWRRPDSYGFAAKDALVPVVGGELSRLAPTMPVAFVEQSGRFELMAMLSLMPRRNMFVGPDSRWLGSYVPAFIRSYPFRLLQREGTDESVLCVDEDSKLVVDGKDAGEDFFDADGNPSQVVKPILNMLGEIDRNRKATQLAVSALAEAGVIQPWPITLKTAQAEQAIGGLHRIDEAGLNALGDDAFFKLRKTSALPLAYMQLLSMGQLGVIEHLEKLQTRLTPPPAASLPESLDSFYQLPNDDLIRFE